MEQHLITLLVKIGVAASIASFGVRSDAVKRMLLREERTLAQRIRMALWFAAIFAPGVLIRVITHGSYAALDLSLEGSLLAGITGGYICGWLAGMMIAVPSLLPLVSPFHPELAALPFLAIAGLVGGMLRDAASEKEDIWRLSPFPDANVYRVLQHRSELRRALFYLFFGFAVRRHGISAPGARLFLPGKALHRCPVGRPAAPAGGRLRLDLFLHHAPTQGLEQHAQRSQAGGAEAPADSGAPRCPGEPDQSALSLQHAELRLHPDPRSTPSRPAPW